jgi:hypothetical protein
VCASLKILFKQREISPLSPISFII